MKNIFSLISRSGNPEKKKLILNFTMLLGYFLISMITFFSISPVYAARPIFRIGIETIAYPSESPLTKIADVDVLQSVKQMKKAGFSNDVNKLFLAYTNRDIAWKTAKTILSKIQDGRINNENISEYTAPDVNVTFISDQNKIGLTIKKIQSYGNLAILSAQQDKGTFPDRMFIKKEYNQDRISIRVIDFVYPDSNNKSKKLAINYITVTLFAEPPYKNWFLSDIYIT